MAKTLIRKRKTPRPIPYGRLWEKHIHLYGGKNLIPHNIKEGIKRFAKGEGKDPLA